MVSLSHCRSLGYYLAVGTRYRLAQVRLQLAAAHASVAVYGVYLAVVIEEYRQVIDVALHLHVLPWATDVLGYECL